MSAGTAPLVRGILFWLTDHVQPEDRASLGSTARALYQALRITTIRAMSSN